MDRAQKKDRKREMRAIQADVMAILNEWAPIGCPTPQDEYDCLTLRVVSLLLQTPTEADVEKLLIEELTNYFGIDPPMNTLDVARRLCSLIRER